MARKGNASRKKITSQKASKKIKELLTFLEHKAPLQTAEKWDNVGLLVGDPTASVRSVVVATDLTVSVLELAKSKKANCIITHHPMIFPKDRGLSAIRSDSLVFQAIQNSISLFSMHTNFDRCALEVSKEVSKALGFKALGRLFDAASDLFLKLVVFVPKTHLEKVQMALFQAGAGQIGNYDFCGFGIEGVGSFRGGDQTKPFLGQKGTLERVEEIRFETILPQGLQYPVLKALFETHPYEEIAYDLYQLSQKRAIPAQGLPFGQGYGVYGDFSKSKSFSELMNSVKSAFQLSGTLVTEPVAIASQQKKSYKRIGFVAGKGSSFISSAISSGCDVFITGEVGFHSAREAAQQGMAVVELGHTQSEQFFLKVMSQWLQEFGLKAFVDFQPVQRFE